ncbi:SAF domain-containing protein [Geodermatophilus sp. SYSU D01186]
MPAPRRRRRPALLALAVAMVVLGAVGAAYLATSLGQTSPVIAVAREVPWGQQITAADLVEARVSADPALAPIPYGDRDRVIGMVAATTLTPGSLLTREALTEQPLPPPGQQLVGVGVSAVQLPATPLRPGDDVLLVPVAAGGGAAAPDPAAPPRTVAATVVRSGAPGTDGLRVVDVLLDAADGPDVAARAAAGLIAIVVVAGE